MKKTNKRSGFNRYLITTFSTSMIAVFTALCSQQGLAITTIKPEDNKNHAEFIAPEPIHSDLKPNQDSHTSVSHSSRFDDPKKGYQMQTSDWSWQLPSVFPLPKVPQDNPMSKAKVELGRFLFYDKRLSANGQVSCANCHIQSLAFTDGKAQSVGMTGEQHPRSSLSLANVAYLPTLNWANTAITQLEQQLLTPLFGEHPVEMGLTDASFKQVQETFAQDERYKTMFSDAFDRQFLFPEDYGLVEISQAIASFERSLISVNSKYDQYIEGRAELTEREIKGKNLFYSEKAECHHCHGSFTFNDQVVHANSRVVPKRFHNTGLYNLDSEGSYPANNEGLYEMTGDELDKGKFRAPSLRNVAVTAPYNHDGSTKTLEEVVANYVAGGRIIRAPNANKGDGRFNPNKSDLIVRIDLTDEEQKDLIAFLRTLTDEEFLTNPNHSDPFLGNR